MSKEAFCSLSQNQEDEDKKKAEASRPKQDTQGEKAISPPNDTSSDSTAPKTQPVSRPVIGTPVKRPTIGTPLGKPVGTTATVGKPVGTPDTSKPVGTPSPAPAQSAQQASTVARPTIERPSIGTPTVGAPKTSVSSPATPGAPIVPKKPLETKQDVSRRNFLRAIAVAGGLLAIAQFAELGPFLQGTVGSASLPTQIIHDIKTQAPLKTSDIKSNSSATFVWPRTGDPNIDNDTFSQCVVIHLPKNLTAPANVSAVDPLSGDTFIAFSRVCVHLWCLWNYFPQDERMECPCHGSQYVPGTGIYPKLPVANNKEPGTAVQGPASLQTAPNNQLPIVLLSIGSDGTISATGRVGQVGCGQKC